MMCQLYGDEEYAEHIKIGKEYWFCFPGNSDVYKEAFGKNAEPTGGFWAKIKITFIRSECMFYVLSDYPNVKEHFASIRSFLAAQMEPAILDLNRENFCHHIDSKLARDFGIEEDIWLGPDEFDQTHTKVIPRKDS